MPTKQLGAFPKKAGSPFAADFLAWNSFTALIQYLGKPDPDPWRKSVGTAALLAMMPVPPFRDPEEVDARLQELRRTRISRNGR
jgi:hypothetical protein